MKICIEIIKTKVYICWDQFMRFRSILKSYHKLYFSLWLVHTYLNVYCLKHRWLLTMNITIHTYTIYSQSSIIHLYCTMESTYLDLQGRRQLLQEGRRLRPSQESPTLANVKGRGTPLMVSGTMYDPYFLGGADIFSDKRYQSFYQHII